MSKKVNKQRKTRERGLNVKITEDTKKSSKSGSVHVNSNFDKKKASKKSTKKFTTKVAAKKTPAKADAKVAEKADAKVTAKAAEKVATKTPKKVEEKQEKVEVKLPASFSRNENFAESFDDVSWAKPEVKPEAKAEPEIKAETKDKAEVKAEPEVKVAPEIEQPEALKLDTSATSQNYSRIITRDVEQITPETEIQLFQQFDTPAKKYEPAEKLEPAQKYEPATEKIVAPAKKSAREIKEQEIKKAVKNATKLPSTKNKRKRFAIRKIGLPRMILAVSCVATAIFAVAYFINLSASDMSLKVAAMQSGIEASYPSYIPRGYSLADVTSASGKVVMRFKCEEGEYVLSEENSTWDANALLTNFVKYEYGDDYTVVKEQGLTLYMGDRWEAWVNGGKLFKLSVTSGSLTKKQLKTIATSL